VNNSKKKFAIFLASNLFIVALFAIPNYDIGLKAQNDQQEFTDGDHIKFLGYTKNEISSSHQNIGVSLKENKSLNIFFGEGQFGGILIFFDKFSIQSFLFSKAVIQTALKALLFPFHTFW
jgi:hypothetical protein